MKRYRTTAPWARPAQELPEMAELESATPARPADLVGELVSSFDGGLAKVRSMTALGISTLAEKQETQPQLTQGQIIRMELLMSEGVAMTP